MILPGDEAELDDLRIGQEIQGHQIGPRFLERGELLLEGRLRIAFEPLFDLARRVADDLVHVRRQLAGKRTPFRRPRRFLGGPGELGPELRQGRLVVGFVDVRKRHRLAAVLLAYRLIVGQVDADWRHRTGIARLDDDVDGVRGDALDARLPVFGIPGHPILEPLGVGGDLLYPGGLLGVDVEHERFPRALDAARVEIHLGEVVDRVNRRRLVANPGNVVRHTVLRLAGRVERDQRTKSRGHRLGGKRNRVREVLHDFGDLRSVPSVHAIDLFDELAVPFHEPRVQRIPLVEALEVLHRHADVQIVRACREDVLARRRRLRRDARIDVRIEEIRLKPREQLIERLALLQRKRRAGLFGRVRRGGKGGRRGLEHEFASGEVVVRAVVDPEQLRVARDLVERRLIDICRMRDDGFEHIAHLEAWRVFLIEKDVATRQRRLVQVPDERLLLQRQRLKAVGVDLYDGRLVDALEQIGPFHRGRRGRSGRRGSPVRVVATSARDGSTNRHDGDHPLQHMQLTVRLKPDTLRTTGSGLRSVRLSLTF